MGGGGGLIYLKKFKRAKLQLKNVFDRVFLVGGGYSFFSKMEKLMVVSQEGDLFEMTQQPIRSLSSLINEFDSFDDPIPLPNIQTKELMSVIRFCSLYQPFNEIKRTLEFETAEELFPEWCVKFTQDLNMSELWELAKAAHYLDLSSLLNLTLCVWSTRVIGKTPEELRELLNVENDLTEEEISKINVKWI